MNQDAKDMSTLLKVALFLTALAGPPVGYIFYNAALSSDNWVYEGHFHWKDGGAHYHGAPGPIMGAGLPLLIGAGGAWLYRRRRRNKTAQ